MFWAFASWPAFGEMVKGVSQFQLIHMPGYSFNLMLGCLLLLFCFMRSLTSAKCIYFCSNILILPTFFSPNLGQMFLLLCMLSRVIYCTNLGLFWLFFPLRYLSSSVYTCSYPQSLEVVILKTSNTSLYLKVYTRSSFTAYVSCESFWQRNSSCH